MNSRERVLAAFSHSEPDRVPVYYEANPGVHRRVLELARVPGDEELLELLGVDFRTVGPVYRGRRLHPELPGCRVDPEWGIRTRWVEHDSGGYWDYCDFPLREADEQAVARWPMPSPDDYDYSGIAEQCARWADKCICVGGPGLGDIINSTGMLRGPEQVLVDLALEDPAALLLIDRRLEVQLEVTRRTLEAARGRVDIVRLGEDLGTQRGPIISPEMFRRLIRPRHQRFVELAKSYGCKVMIHSCGSSSWAFEDFIEMGIDGVETLQPEAKDMSPEYLKARYGSRLAFQGCISTAGVLATGDVEDVRRLVRQTLEVMMPGGGYCLAPTHMIQDNTPAENVLEMYRTALEFGRYGSSGR